MTVADDLKTARQHLVERGWNQGGLINGGRVCAMGALNLACWGEVRPGLNADVDRRGPAFAALAKHVPSEFGDEVAMFNDAPTTEFEDVLNLFDKALAELGAL
jgi:hypothetical protein